MTMTSLGIGAGAGGAMRFSQTRGRIGNAAQGISYPSPFFDVAQTYLPTTVKQMLRWCRYYFLTSPLINSVVCKLSEYPITDLIIDGEDATAKRWMNFIQDNLLYRSFQIEVGLDYFTYGNAFVSVGYQFDKYLSCAACGWNKKASQCRSSWVFTNYAFRLTCPGCNQTAPAVVRDLYLKNPSGVKLIRWNPEDIEITYNDLTGMHTYFYTIPQTVRNDVILGRKEIVEGIPQLFIQAMREQKGLILSPDKVFHLRRPTLATIDRGWGTPLLLPVLKDTYYLQLMKKAQEAILLEHIVPMRTIFPQPASGTSDPFTSINLADWRDHVAAEIMRWRYDPNYIPIMPLPIGNQTIGGDGKALLLVPEMRETAEQIIAGMGVPRELIFGGLSYAGSNVSMRMVENMFLGYVLRHKQLFNFVMREIASFLEWPEVKGRFKPFKMADDIQRKAYLFQLNQANKISDTTLLADVDLSQTEENRLMIDETKTRIQAAKAQQLAMAEMQGEAQLVMTKYQIKAQHAMQEAAASMQPAPGEPGGMDAAQQGGGTPGGQEAGAPAPGAAAAGVQGPAGVDPSMVAPPTATPQQSFDNAIKSRLGLNQNMQQSGMTGVDLPSMAMANAQQISALDPAMQQMAITNLQISNPPLAALVEQYLKQLQKDRQQTTNGLGANGAAASTINTTPLPEARGPRRAAGIV